MIRYIIYCTESQTLKALELGAPVKYTVTGRGRLGDIIYTGVNKYSNPTAEQMLGWLEKQGFYFRLNTNGCSVEIDYNCILELVNTSRKEATLAAIDAALEYLSNNKK